MNKIQNDMECMNDPKYKKLCVQKIHDYCVNHKLDTISNYTREIAWLKKSKQYVEDQNEHPGSKGIFEIKNAIRAFVECHREELESNIGFIEEYNKYLNLAN